MAAATYPVTCPTCFEEFEVPLPPAAETPCVLDYDCEVCCRPMEIDVRRIEPDEGEDDEFDFEFGNELIPIAVARGIHE